MRLRESLVLSGLVAMGVFLVGNGAFARHGGRPGEEVSLSGHRFRVWGSARAGVMPKGCLVTPDGAYLLVSNFGRRHGEAVTVFSLPGLCRVGGIHLRGNAVELAVSPDGRRLYTTNKIGYLLQVFDLPTLALVASFPVGGFPKVIAVSGDGRILYVSLWESASVVRIHLPTGTTERLRTRKRNPRGLALCGRPERLFVANNGTNVVTVVDPVQWRVLQHIPVGRHPRHAACAPDRRRLYVSLMGPDQVAVVDPDRSRLLRRVRVGRDPKTLAVSPDGRFVYTANYMGHSMSILDTRTWKTAELPLNLWKASGLAVHPSGRWIYVTGWCSDDVWAVEHVPPGGRPHPLGPVHPPIPMCRGCPGNDYMGCRGRTRRRGRATNR